MAGFAIKRVAPRCARSTLSSPAAAGALAPAVVAALAGRVTEVGEDLLGGDPDLLGMEFEAECSHVELPFMWLVASSNHSRGTLAT
jgi:hypothetical protein